LLTFTRKVEGESIACAFNLSAEAIAHDAPEGETILAVNGATDSALPPYAAIITKIA
jgi:alpha-glucosidase